MSHDTSAGRYDLVITRILDAPRELVFKAWTDPEHVVRWWRPGGCTLPVCELDLRPGGAVRYDMRGPDGTIYPSTGVVRDVVPPDRLTVVMSLDDDAGKARYRVEWTVTLEADNSKTRLTLRVRVLEIADPTAERHLASMKEGWTQILERLAEHLAAETAGGAR
jgi:uncharacterized protein YndB with AHSA1/START domain